MPQACWFESTCTFRAPIRSVVPADATVGELARALIVRMNLPQTDVEGHPLSYHVRLEREGRHLHPAETVGDVLQENDQIILQPKIQAGG